MDFYNVAFWSVCSGFITGPCLLLGFPAHTGKAGPKGPGVFFQNGGHGPLWNESRVVGKGVFFWGVKTFTAQLCAFPCILLLEVLSREIRSQACWARANVAESQGKNASGAFYTHLVHEPHQLTNHLYPKKTRSAPEPSLKSHPRADLGTP